jgi:hypothetical protein
MNWFSLRNSLAITYLLVITTMWSEYIRIITLIALVCMYFTICFAGCNVNVECNRQWLHETAKKLNGVWDTLPWYEIISLHFFWLSRPVEQSHSWSSFINSHFSSSRRRTIIILIITVETLNLLVNWLVKPNLIGPHKTAYDSSLYTKLHMQTLQIATWE